MSTQPHNPLHGITLEQILNELVAHFGWPELGRQVNIRCFTTDPSVPSSLKFLRRTPWAREKVESLYLFMLREQKRAPDSPAAGRGLRRKRGPGFASRRERSAGTMIAAASGFRRRVGRGRLGVGESRSIHWKARRNARCPG